jgi:hypothetical protein
MPGAAKAASKAARAASRTLKDEQAKWQAVIKSTVEAILKYPKEVVLPVVETVPKFLRLLIAILKSKQADAKLKATIVGAIVVIASVLGVEVAGVSRWTLFAIATAIAGPFTGIAVVLAHDINVAALLVVLVLATCGICITVLGSDEVKKLAVELWGEEEGSSFIETMEDSYLRFRSYIDPVSKYLSGMFHYIGTKTGGSVDSLAASVAGASESAKSLVEKLSRRKAQS